jgi:hypothetical protein
VVKVSANHDDRISGSKQHADQVRLLQVLDRLFGEVAPLASGRLKHRFQGSFPLRIISLITLQSLFQHFLSLTVWKWNWADTGNTVPVKMNAANSEN